MGPFKFSMLNDDWEVEGDHCFISPLNSEHPEQTIIFADQMKNGSIQADITPIKGVKSMRGEEGKEGAILFRYSGYEGYYYAGLSAFRTKFFIGKVLPGPVWQLLGSIGRRESISYSKTYRLRVDFFGNQITLFENDVRQIVVYDENYHTGQWGLGTWRTSARFDNVKISISQPICFVIMPFSSELDFVYQVIQETVKEYGLKCVRADEVLVSCPIVEDIKALIAEADLVIVDFTGKNPNVYYEAGIADAWKKKWIVLAQTPDDLTFDVKHIRTIIYSNKMGADVKLQENLRQAIHETLGFHPK